eukprot:sb/3462108/
MKFSKDSTKHPEFREPVYQRIKEKYHHFHLPYSWIEFRKKAPNVTRLLNTGMETPSSQKNAPKMFSPGWGKQNLIKSFATKENILTNSLSVRVPYQTMLSTQFNKDMQNTIPLFSNNNNCTLAYSGYSNTSAIDGDLMSETPFTIGSPESIYDNNTQIKDPVIYKVASGHRTPTLKSLSSISVKEESVTPKRTLAQEPFVSICELTERERENICKLLTETNIAAISLFYSDQTSNLLLQTGKKYPSEKITVSGIAVLVNGSTRSCSYNIFIPISAVGDNNEQSVSFLKCLFSSAIPKVTFNAYQLLIVCSVLMNRQSGACVNQLMDLKIASWLLNSDDVPQNLPDFLTQYNIAQPMGSTVLNRLHSSLKSLLVAHKIMVDMLAKEKLTNIFTLLETPLMETTSAMGQSGISINNEKLSEISQLISIKLIEVEKEASALLGRPVLLTSPTQMRQILYEELQLDMQISNKLTRTAALKEKSTSEACLLKLTSVHPLPRLILLHRRLSKTKSTYLDGILPYIRYGKLYPSWDQTSASTGRLVSCNPNIQAFPKEPLRLGFSRTVTVRDVVVPSLGHKFVAVDFCSIELRILAHFAKDQELIDAITAEGDVFINLAASWRSIDISQVTSEDRNKTKRVCYAIIYGVGIPKLSEILEVPISEAKVLMNSFIQRFQNISRFTNAVINKVRQTKKLHTILYRLRNFAEINSQNFHLRKAMERQAVNFVIQGSAADICKLAMLKVSAKPVSKLLIQIHDELLYEVVDGSELKFAREIYRTLESTEFVKEANLSIPLKIDNDIMVLNQINLTEAFENTLFHVFSYTLCVFK